MSKIMIAAIIVAFSSTGFAQSRLTLYQLDGSVHCRETEVMTPEQAADSLRQAGVRVVSSEVGQLPVNVSGACGTPTGKVVMVEVDAGDWHKAARQRADGYGFGIWVFDQPRVEVYKYDGSLQCDRGEEIPLDVMARELAGNGIEVLASRKGNDGRVHIAMCGASTGSLNVYSIDSQSLDKARELGFELLVTRQMSREIGSPASVRLRAPAFMRSPPRDPAGQARNSIPLLW